MGRKVITPFNSSCFLLSLSDGNFCIMQITHFYITAPFLNEKWAKALSLGEDYVEREWLLTRELQERKKCIPVFHDATSLILHIGFKKGLPSDLKIAEIVSDTPEAQPGAECRTEPGSIKLNLDPLAWTWSSIRLSHSLTLAWFYTMAWFYLFIDRLFWGSGTT